MLKQHQLLLVAFAVCCSWPGHWVAALALNNPSTAPAALPAPLVQQLDARNTTNSSTALALASSANTTYTCTLAVEGYGKSSSSSSSSNAPGGQRGIKSLALNCSSATPAAPSLTVSYDSGALQAGTTAFNGVQPVLLDSGMCNESFINLTAVLYFCSAPGTALIFDQPTVQGVWLDVADKDAAVDTGLLAFGGNGTAVIINSGRFEHNHAGTPISLVDSVVLHIINQTRISNNAARDGGGLKIGHQSTAAVTGGSAVLNNTARFGGGVYVYGRGRFSLLGGSSVMFNAAGDGAKGGGVFAKEDAVVLVTEGSRVDWNTAPDGGGLVVEGSARCAVAGNSSVSSNTAFKTSGGGVLVDNVAELRLLGASVSGNFAAKQGGGVALMDASSASCIVDCASVIASNRAAEQGGGLYLGPGTSAVVQGASLCELNSAKSGAGAFVSGEDKKKMPNATSLTIQGQGTVFRRNSGTYGAAVNVYSVGGQDVGCVVSVLDGVLLQDNFAEEGGGGFVSSGRCNVSFVGSQLQGNSVLKQGGAFSVYGSSRVVFLDSNITRNTAKDAAGGNIGQSAIVVFNRSAAEQNRVVHGGAAFMIVENAQLSLFGSTVSTNQALLGGAVSIEDNATVTLDNSTLRSNTADTSGGAVHMLGPGSSKLVFSNRSYCAGNTAGISGGCAYLVSGGVLNIDSSSAIAVNAARFGGGVALAALQTAPDLGSLRQRTFGNSAGTFGSDLYMDWEDITLSLQFVVSDGVNTSATQLLAAGGVIPYVSRSSGPGLLLSVAARGQNGTELAAGVKIEALLLLGGTNSPGTAAAAEIFMMGSSTTDERGEALLPSLHPKQPPGDYTLRLQYTTLAGVPFVTDHTLRIRECVLGEVTGSAAGGRAAVTCDVCPPGKYSLSDVPPHNQQCHDCGMETSNCSVGAAVVLPLPGFWQRSPMSALMHR